MTMKFQLLDQDPEQEDLELEFAQESEAAVEVAVVAEKTMKPAVGMLA